MINFNNIEMLEIGGRNMPVSEHIEYVEAEHQQYLADFAQECAANFVNENTIPMSQIGRPSFIARLDYTVVDDEPKVFEFEERPSGMGITAYVSPEFDDRVSDLFKAIGDVAVVLSEMRQSTDDYILGLDALSLEEAEKQERPLLIRAEPQEQGYQSLVRKSISTVKTKGDKSYGEQLGFLTPINHRSQLPHKSEPFALKPRQGSKAKDVFLYHPMRKGEPGFSSYKRLRNFVDNNEMYLQEYHSPINTGNCTFPNMIYRLFINMSQKAPELMGGCYMARKDAIVHGSRHAVIGELALK